MFFLIVFVFSTYSLLDLIFSDFQRNILKINDWKKVEGIVFKVQGNDDVVLIIRFLTNNSEWITGEPMTFHYNNINGPFEGDKVAVWYNPDEPTQFALNTDWFVKNRWMLSIITALFFFFVSLYSFSQMIETGFAEDILHFFD